MRLFLAAGPHQGLLTTQVSMDARAAVGLLNPPQCESEPHRPENTGLLHTGHVDAVPFCLSQGSTHSTWY